MIMIMVKKKRIEKQEKSYAKKAGCVFRIRINQRQVSSSFDAIVEWSE
jgi:hypothetical protein